MKEAIRKLKHFGLSAFAITCLSATISSTAQAGVYKTISGTSCVSAMPASAASLSRNSGTGITAEVGNLGLIYCPLEIDSPSAGLPVQIYLYYTKKTTSVIVSPAPPTPNMTCFVRSTSWDRSQSMQTLIPTVVGDDNNAFITVDTHAYGHMVVFCSFPNIGDSIQSINYKLN